MLKGAVHCGKCNECFGSIGGQFKHCAKCGVCVKDSWECCKKCGKCRPTYHKFCGDGEGDMVRETGNNGKSGNKSGNNVKKGGNKAKKVKRK